jgi:hypothetical protein
MGREGILQKYELLYIDQSIHTVATFSGVLIGNDIEHAAVSAYM